jgi:hypothetical protein
MKRGKQVESNKKNKKIIKNLDRNDGYKYLGVMEAHQIKKIEMKKKLSQEFEYERRIRKVLKTKLKGAW